jgi:hypothetical protein
VIREALRPARPVLWVAVPVAVVLLATLAALAALAAGDPGVRLQRRLEQAGLQQVSVEVRRGTADRGASHVRVTYRSDLGAAGAGQESDQVLRLVWTEFRGRIDSVSVQTRETPGIEPVAAAELQRRLGPRPDGASQAGYAASHDRAVRVTLLAVLAVLTTFVLVFCAATAAVLVVRRVPRRPATSA